MTPETKRLIEDIKRRPLSELVGRRTKLKKAGGGRFTGLCPLHSEKTPSFTVNDSKCHFRCFGCDAHGDAITFLRKIDNLPFFDAVDQAAAFFGLAPDKDGVRKREYKVVEPAETPEEEAARKALDREKALQLWRRGIPAGGTIVERYLIERGISIAHLPGGIVPPSIKCHPACDYWYQSFLPGGGRTKPKLLGRFPAMIGLLQDINGDPQGLHITYMNPLAPGKFNRYHPDDVTISLPAKKMIGTAWACHIRLGPLQEYMSGSEGIENGLSGMMCGTPPALVAGSLNNIAGRGLGEGEPHPRRLDKKLPTAIPDMESVSFIPPPPVKKFLLIKDNDSKDQESADALFDRGMWRWRTRGIEVQDFTPDKGMDMNDMVKRGLLKPCSWDGGTHAA